jgi:hypothetical protein
VRLKHWFHLPSTSFNAPRRYHAPAAAAISWDKKEEKKNRRLPYCGKLQRQYMRRKGGGAFYFCYAVMKAKHGLCSVCCRVSTALLATSLFFLCTYTELSPFYLPSLLLTALFLFSSTLSEPSPQRYFFSSSNTYTCRYRSEPIFFFFFEDCA